MSSKLFPFSKFKITPQLYWLVLFLMYSNRGEYIELALYHRDWTLLLKVLLSMCSPLAIAIAKPTRSEWKKALRYARYSKAYPYNK